MNIQDFSRSFVAWRSRVALHDGTDLESTDRRIREGARFAPEHFWLLGCSALLASIGLDTSSAAVVIGAMLISPLMGPILAIGYAAETNDRDLLLGALRELGLATVASLVVSAAYFIVSPLAQPTPELQSRIHPTLLDVGVALFGGVAGVVAVSRRNPSLALPGVAIATALMPPLCTAGFGLATLRPTFLFGALYLYIINAIFIALATAAVARLLRVPPRAFPTELARRRAHRWVLSIVVVALLPSLYFLFQSARQTQERRRVERFLTAEVRRDTREVIRWDFARDSVGRVLRVYVAGAALEPAAIDSLRTRLATHGLEDTGLRVLQSEVTASTLARLRTDAVQGVLEALATARPAAGDSSREMRIRSASRELAAAFPEVTRVIFASIPNALDTAGVRRPLLILELLPRTPAGRERQVLEGARAFIAARLQADSIEVIRR